MILMRPRVYAMNLRRRNDVAAALTPLRCAPAHSAGIGHGSEFVIRLPLLAGPVKTQEHAVGPSVSTRRRRILVVDDNRDAADSLATLLKLTGHDVYTANDGLEAVEAAAMLQPDVILLDIGMPRLNGYEAARRIRGGPQLLRGCWLRRSLSQARRMRAH